MWMSLKSVKCPATDIVKKVNLAHDVSKLCRWQEKNLDYFYSATMGEQKDNATGWFSFLSCCFLSTELKNKSALSENQWNARGAQYALDRMPAQRAKSTCTFDTAEMEREYQRKATLFLHSHIPAYKMICNN